MISFMGCSNCVSGETFLACICPAYHFIQVALREVFMKSKQQGLRLSSYHHYVAGSETSMVFLRRKFRYSYACDAFPPTTYSEIDYSSIRHRFIPPNFLSFCEWGRTFLGSPRSQIFISSTSASKCLDHTWV